MQNSFHRLQRPDTKGWFGQAVKNVFIAAMFSNLPRLFGATLEASPGKDRTRRHLISLSPWDRRLGNERPPRRRLNLDGSLLEKGPKNG
jgi:hypothetical protein